MNSHGSAAAQPYLDAAREIERWLDAVKIPTEHGFAWPVAPEQVATQSRVEAVDRSFYSGSAGVVFFLEELANATGSARARELARAGANELLATLPDRVEGEGAGLYTGIAGVGFVLSCMDEDEPARDPDRGASDSSHERDGSGKYAAGAERCVDLLHRHARVAGSGIEWSDCTDVISGGSGIGLFLLHCGGAVGKELATRAGRRLLDLEVRERVGCSWRMDSKFPRVMPNFSHGTAGVAFFLARLHEATGERAFLDAALDGARHLLSIADTRDGGCRIGHDTPDNPDLYYLGWCHGPVGTARLFGELARATGDPEWVQWVRRSARSLETSGIPEQLTPGFWNNVSECCGSAGVAEFFLDLHDCSRDPEELAFARRLLDDVLRRGARDEKGLRFVQAEHRVKPDLLLAQTGYMQGAAGVGCALLHLARAMERQSGHDGALAISRATLPDAARFDGCSAPVR